MPQPCVADSTLDRQRTSCPAGGRGASMNHARCHRPEPETRERTEKSLRRPRRPSPTLPGFRRLRRAPDRRVAAGVLIETDPAPARLADQVGVANANLVRRQRGTSRSTSCRTRAWSTARPCRSEDRCDESLWEEAAPAPEEVPPLQLVHSRTEHTSRADVVAFDDGDGVFASSGDDLRSCSSPTTGVASASSSMRILYLTAHLSDVDVATRTRPPGACHHQAPE
jgi:hypothetical protein